MIPLATLPEIVAGLKKEMEGMAERIEKLETLNDALKQIELKMVEISTRLSQQERTMQNVEKSLNELKEKPGRKWEGFLKALMGALITAFVTYVFTKTYYQPPA